MSETVVYNTNVQPEKHGYYTDYVLQDPGDFVGAEEFRLAGTYLHKKLTKMCPGFKWLKCHRYETAFDDMTFIYKNTVFSVLLKIYYNGEEIADKEQEYDFLKKTKANGFVPCIFPIMVKVTDSSKKISTKTRTGFNLFNYKTGSEINPLTIASDDLVRRSWYELGLISAEVITEALKKKHIYLSDCLYYDPENASSCPILSCYNDKREECRIVVKYFKSLEELKAADFEKLSKLGNYFAPVIMDCKKKGAYRNNDMNIHYSSKILIKLPKA